MFPLRRFFSGGTQSAEGEDMSWDAVKEKLKVIIADEDKNNPLNDDEIVERLKAQGHRPRPPHRREVPEDPKHPHGPPAAGVLTASRRNTGVHRCAVVETEHPAPRLHIADAGKGVVVSSSN